MIKAELGISELQNGVAYSWHLAAAEPPLGALVKAIALQTSWNDTGIFTLSPGPSVISGFLQAQISHFESIVRLCSHHLGATEPTY